MKDEAYRIKSWWKRHSSGESRRRKGIVVEFPTDQTSEGLSILMETSDGRSTFAIYCLLAEFAGTLPDAINGEDVQGHDYGPANSDLAGVLYDDRGPFDSARLARKLPVSAKAIDAALRRLEQPDVGWIDRVPFPDFIREHSGQPPDGVRESPGDYPPHAPVRTGGRAPADDPSITPSSITPSGGAGGRGYSPVLDALHSRLGRKLTATDEKRVYELAGGLESDPLEADGKTWSASQVLVMAIEAMPTTVRVWHRYVAATIDNCRADSALPGTSSEVSDAKQQRRQRRNETQYAEVGEAKRL